MLVVLVVDEADEAEAVVVGNVVPAAEASKLCTVSYAGFVVRLDQ